jgi:hypothetical protein
MPPHSSAFQSKVPNKLRMLLHLKGKHGPADWSYCGHCLIFAYTYNEIAVRFKTVTQKVLVQRKYEARKK